MHLIDKEKGSFGDKEKMFRLTVAKRNNLHFVIRNQKFQQVAIYTVKKENCQIIVNVKVTLLQNEQCGICPEHFA